MENQLRFNNMLESQIGQLVVAIPLIKKGKIPRQPKEPETINLVEVVKSRFYKEPSLGRFRDESLPIKKGDPGRPVIPIMIGPHEFNEVVCDLGASVNVMPKVIYDSLHFNCLLYTTMHLQLAYQSICQVEGIVEDILLRVGCLYVPVDFVVLDTSWNPRAPIILGCPFLHTTKAIIYVDSAKICFHIKDRKERFSFKSCKVQPLNMLQVQPPTRQVKGKKKKNLPQATRGGMIESINMIITRYDQPPLRSDYGYLLNPPFITNN